MSVGQYWLIQENPKYAAASCHRLLFVVGVQ
jgi:hypothetical protein